MSPIFKRYSFEGFHLDADEESLLYDEEPIQLERRVFQTLLLLVENAGRTVTKDEFLEKVWNDAIVEEGNLTVAVAKLRKALKDKNNSANFIETVSRKGYRFNKKIHIRVTETPVRSEESFVEDNPIHLQDTVVPVRQSAGKRVAQFAVYTLSAGLVYAMLFWVALLLEIAYRFDDFGTKALWLGIPVIVWMFSITVAALLWTKNLIERSKKYSFFAGALILFSGIVFLCLMLRFFIPDQPISGTRFQSQPAFAAYLKNAFIYFFPLGIIFILAPFYLICSKRFSTADLKPLLLNKLSHLLQPAYLFRLWILMLIYSIISTFYLLNNLAAGKYHGLFVTLVFVRFFFYFGLGGGSLLWYYINLAAESGSIRPLENEFYPKWKPAVLILLTVTGLGFFWAVTTGEKVPRLEKVEIISLPDKNRQLFIRLNGENFDANVVRVRVIGLECFENDPCEVPNNVIRKMSNIKGNSLERIPLTLPPGEFQIFVQNGESKMSNGIALTVP